MRATELPDLASARLGGAVLAANDEFFAAKDNLVQPSEPVFDPDRFTHRGKWMDGWETRRRREEPGHDWCLVRLGAPGIVRAVVVDTSHFRGNHPQAASLEGCAVDGQPSPDELDEAGWEELLSRRELDGDAQNVFELDAPRWVTHLRLRIYPDGGVARLRVHGEALPRWGHELAGGRTDLAAVGRGGHVVDATDAFFASPDNMLLPGPPWSMADGWETRRRRDDGHDRVVLRLGAVGRVRALTIDTSFYKGNAPAACTLEGWAPAEGRAPPEGAPPDDADWQPMLERTPLQPNAAHELADGLADVGPVSHLRLGIHPDGGIARLRVHGELDDAEVRRQGLRRLDALPEPAARAALVQCCGASRWVEGMLEARPFGDPERLFETADATWNALGRDDWLEAFRAHPRIGEKKASRQTGAAASRWSAREQSSVDRTGEQTRQALAEGNRAYEERFGWIFIIYAAGKTPEEMLSNLRERMDHDPDEELRVAAEEQRKITRLRLGKLLSA